MTRREQSIDRAILIALNAVPSGMLLGDETLRADAARIVVPRASTAELDARILALDEMRRIAGIQGETGMEREITQAGRLWLMQNP